MTADELTDIVGLLESAGHGPDDFEAECPSCTAHKKLSAIQSAPAQATAEIGRSMK